METAGEKLKTMIAEANANSARFRRASNSIAEAIASSRAHALSEALALVEADRSSSG